MGRDGGGGERQARRRRRGILKAGPKAKLAPQAAALAAWRDERRRRKRRRRATRTLPPSLPLRLLSSCAGQVPSLLCSPLVPLRSPPLSECGPPGCGERRSERRRGAKQQQRRRQLNVLQPHKNAHFSSGSHTASLQGGAHWGIAAATFLARALWGFCARRCFCWPIKKKGGSAITKASR